MRGRRAIAVPLLVTAALLSVASPKKTRSDDPFTSRSATPPPDRPSPARRPIPPEPKGLPYPACPAAPGVIQRRDLLRILDRAPGVFLQGVDVTMVPATQLPGGKPFWKRPKGQTGNVFGGWAIRRFHLGDPCLDRTGLRAGDIIADVNGSILRHPDDLARLWKELRTAPRIIVRLYRAGRPLVFVVKIADRSPRRSPMRPINR